MQKATIEYCVDGYNTIVIPINSMDELEKNLQKIKLSEAVVPFTLGPDASIFTVDVVVEDVGVITVGLDERSYLCYQSANLDSSFMSLGDETAKGLTAYYAGDYTPLSNKHVIPFSDALKALNTWINTGRLSDSIKWTDNLYPLDYL